ncbi:hypothetical protein ACQ86O_12495 [Serratia sp. L9]|uniref:hypothetical protein n=1 Tax=Serratia sp. L9 TaxID=3423946 RepID=UPI003D671F98
MDFNSLKKHAQLQLIMVCMGIMGAVYNTLADRDQLHRHRLKTRVTNRFGFSVVGNPRVYLQNNKDESNAVIQQTEKI